MRYILVSFVMLFVSAVSLMAAGDNGYYDTVNVRREFFADTERNWEALKDTHMVVEDYGKPVGIYFSHWQNGFDIMFYPAYQGENFYRTYGRIVYRFGMDRTLLFVKVYFLENNDSYVLFKKTPSETYDVYLLGRLFRSGLQYHFAIDKLLYLSLDSILSVLDDDAVSSEISLRGDDQAMKEKFINKVVVPAFAPYSDDGAFDQFGENVSINSLDLLPPDKKGVNCSGFVKEVIDNYLTVLDPGHKRIAIDLLKKRDMESDPARSQYTRYEFTRDPFFGRDWMNNLVTEFNAASGLAASEAEEIRDDQYASYFKDRGFYLDDLSYILFRDQMKDQSAFYVAVFNKYNGTNTLVPSFYHMALLVPYAKGKHFYIRVFESGEETDYNTLIKNHLPQYIEQETFDKELLERRLEGSDEERELLKKWYRPTRNQRGYQLDMKIDENDAVRVAKIFSRIEYREEKVLIYRFPLSYHFY